MNLKVKILRLLIRCLRTSILNQAFASAGEDLYYVEVEGEQGTIKVWANSACMARKKVAKWKEVKGVSVV